MRQQWVKEAFCKFHLGTVGVLKHEFLPQFEPVVAHLAHRKPHNLESGPSLDPKRMKNGFTKVFFQKLLSTIWDTITSVFSPFSARGDTFWPMENPKML